MNNLNSLTVAALMTSLWSGINATHPRGRIYRPSLLDVPMRDDTSERIRAEAMERRAIKEEKRRVNIEKARLNNPIFLK